MRAVAAVAERTGAAACLAACQGPVVPRSNSGHAVRLDASEPDNLKLTTPDDLDLARRLVAAWDARHGGGSVSS
jgi:hypothetical protein